DLLAAVGAGRGRDQEDGIQATGLNHVAYRLGFRWGEIRKNQPVESRALCVLHESLDAISKHDTEAEHRDQWDRNLRTNFTHRAKHIRDADLLRQRLDKRFLNDRA